MYIQKNLSEMKEKLISINELIDEIYEHKLLRSIPIDSIIRKTVSFMKLVGAPNMFENKTAVLQIDCYRAALPCDFYKIISVRPGCGNESFSYRDATDTFFFSDKKERNAGLTYKIQGNVIYTSTEDKPIEISYLSIPVDDLGYPMLPDNESFKRALIAYIKKEKFTDLFDEGKIQKESLQLAQQDYAWAVGDCDSEFHRMTIDEAESFYNGFSELVIRANEHASHFVGTGDKEIIKKH